MGFLPEIWRRDLAKAAAPANDCSLCKTATAGRGHLHKVIGHLGAGNTGLAEEQTRMAMDSFHEIEQLHHPDEAPDDDDDGMVVDTSEKATRLRFDARTADITKIDLRDPMAFRKALSIVRAHPEIARRG